MEINCSICFEKYNEFKIKLYCNHNICLNCIILWIYKKKNCPICRRELQENEIQTILKIKEWKLYTETDDNINTKEKRLGLYSIGYCLKKGILLEKNINESIKWFEKSIKYDDIVSLTELSYIYETEYKNNKKAFEYLDKANNIIIKYNKIKEYQENIIEQDNINKLLFIHNTNIKITPETRVWYNLANFYYIGKGCEKNYELAFKYFLKGANNGLLESQYNVAVCYQEGIGVKKNILNALKWYIKSAKDGYKKSIELLKKNNIKYENNKIYENIIKEEEKCKPIPLGYYWQNNINNIKY